VALQDVSSNLQWVQVLPGKYAMKDREKLVRLADACSEILYGGNSKWEKKDFLEFVEDVTKHLETEPEDLNKVVKSSNQFFGNIDTTFHFEGDSVTFEFKAGEAIEGTNQFTYAQDDTEDMEESLCAFLARINSELYSNLVTGESPGSTISFEIADEVTFTLFSHDDEEAYWIEIDTPEETFEGGDYSTEKELKYLQISFLNILSVIDPSKYTELSEEAEERWEAAT